MNVQCRDGFENTDIYRARMDECVLAEELGFDAYFLAVPGPVIASYLLAMLASLFMVGVKVTTQEGMDHHMRLGTGISFCVGVAF